MKDTGIREGFRGEMVFRLNREQVGHATKDKLFRDLYVTDIGYFPHASNHFVDRLTNPLQECVLIYCIGGEGWYEQHGRRSVVGEGQFVVIPPDTPHCYGSVPGWQIYWLHFGGSQSTSFCERLSAECTQARGPEPSEAIGLFEKMIRYAESGLTVSNVSFLHYAAWHLLGTFTLPARTGAGGESAESRIDASIHFLKEHVSDSVGLEDMAEHAGYSCSHFIQLFRERTGYSPVDFFIQLKIQHASKLLTTTGLKILEISQHCGYDDPYYFSRLFKKISGYSPKHYRQQFKV